MYCWHFSRDSIENILMVFLIALGTLSETSAGLSVFNSSSAFLKNSFWNFESGTSIQMSQEIKKII